MNENDIDDHQYWAQQEQQTQKLRESLPDDVKAYTAQHITDYLNSLSPEDKDIWVACIGNDPILQRIIYYVSSPPEDVNLRLRMIAKNDIDVDFNIKYTCFVRTLPENRSDVLRIYLSKLTENILRVITADCQKRSGADESIEELRRNCLRTEKIDSGQKTIMDHSPWTKYELLKTPKEKVLTIYILDESDMVSRFEVDSFLIGWMQSFENSAIRDEAFSDKLLVRVVNRHGKEIPAPAGYRNPFYFSLLEKYEPLLRKIHNLWKTNLESMKKNRKVTKKRKSRSHDETDEDNRKIPDTPDLIEYEDVVSCFYAVLKDSPGYVNPEDIRRKIIDLYRHRGGRYLDYEAPIGVEIDETIDENKKFRKNDPQQILLNKEAWKSVLEDETFRSLFTSDNTKTTKERQYMHRHIDKIKKRH